MNTPTILQGNTFTLAIPLRVYILGEGGVVLEDYTPDEGDEVVITLKGPRRFYTYTPRIDGNVARIDLGGYELCGLYSVAVAITKDDGQKLRTYRGAQLSIVESIDAVTDSELEQGIEQGVLYLDAATFLSGADGRGIESVVKTATAGRVDTYTITYTDGTTSTFDVTNGRDGEDGQPGAPGTPGEDGVGIVSIAKTGTVGLVDIYTIALTNGATYTFEVTNGKDGTTPDMSNYYDKGETNDLLGGKISKGSLKTINNESLEGSGNLSLATQEALSNYCPIIEENSPTRVDHMTADAPFATLLDGQRIIFKAKWMSVRDCTLNLTLSDGNVTGDISIKKRIAGYLDGTSIDAGEFRPDGLYELIYSGKTWWLLGFGDTNNIYQAITQAEIDAGTSTVTRLVTPKLLRDNFYIKQEVNNLCPIIQDTRSSAVAAITGNAPFSSLVDGQRILLHTNQKLANDATLNLTLSDNTTTGDIPLYAASNSVTLQRMGASMYNNLFLSLVYESAENRWVMVGQRDTNTTYSAISQAEIDAGSATGNRVVAPKLLCDNFSKVTTMVTVSSTGDVSQALDSGKFYRFGTIDSLALTFNSPQAGMGSYGGKFTASASWSALGIPATIDEAAGNDSIESGKTYEFSMLDNVIVIKEV